MRINRTKSKHLFALLITIVMMGSFSLEAKAYTLPYDTYNYDYRNDIVFTPAAYIPEKSIAATGLNTSGLVDENGEEIQLSAFSNPQDLCVAPDGSVYVADTGNNRIVVLDHTLKKCLKIISSFDHEGTLDTFNAPNGVCVSENNQLYIADTMNKRVVVLELTGELIKIVENPQSEILEDNFSFAPLKVTVDYADRIYCIAQNVFEGLMVFENTGEFTGYFGTIKVDISLFEKFWRKISTKEQRSRQALFIPTTFTGIDVDSDGFIYASNLDSLNGVQAVRRLNPKGEDVIKKGIKKNVGGDLWIIGSSKYSGPSEMTDVVYRDKGMYSLLDRKRGRVFTYDHEGNLLYIFGGLGTQAGTFKAPVAIEILEDKIIVLDSLRAEILTFSPTEYGNLINDAVALRFDGDETLAEEKWLRVLELDENNELANSGIGKALLTKGDYKNAMKYLELGMNREYYSIAFKRYRNEMLEGNMNLILSVLLVLIVVYAVVKRRRDKKQGKVKEGGLL